MASAQTPTPRLISFICADVGDWRIDSIHCIVGVPVAAAARLSMVSGPTNLAADIAWTLRGVTSNERYVIRDEKSALVGKQEDVGRASSRCAALILIRKNFAWWSLTQDERRAIFEDRSRHIAIGLAYLPAIARGLHRCRDLEAEQPFDFLSWFEFAADDSAQVDELATALRRTPEWRQIARSRFDSAGTPTRRDYLIVYRELAIASINTTKGVLL